jgi:hypothetical protein
MTPQTAETMRLLGAGVGDDAGDADDMIELLREQLDALM